MTRKRVSASLAIASAAMGLVAAATMPVASAGPVGNGLTVDCTQDSDVHATCIIGGCARVNGDYVIDAIHIKLNGGEQDEREFKCINAGTTARTGIDNNRQDVHVAVQGCRKKDFEGDWCSPWGDYTFKPPAKPQEAQKPVQCPAGSESDTVPAGQQCKPKAVVMVQCPEGSPTPQVPQGQQCAAVPAQTNKIQASFGQPGTTSVDFTVTNQSTLNAACDYVATTNSINPLVKKKTTRTINVPANQSTTTTFDGAPTLSTYNVTLTCKDASGQQKEPLGTVQTSLTW